ncbi:MAG: efflux RND transporter periplasmic adaptor subunit [Cyanobacteria bacterium J069]
MLGSGVLALLSLGGWAVYVWAVGRAPDPIPVQLLTVKQGTVETVINESGTVELGSQQTLLSPLEGAVERVLVEPGDRIQQGQTLVVLRNPDRQTALLNQDLLTAKQAETLARSQTQVRETKAQLDADQAQLTRLQGLAEAGALSRERVEQQATEVRRAMSALRDAETDVKTARLELQSLQLQQQRTRQELQDTVISAPIDGVVLGLSVKDGDGVDRRTDLLTLGDPRRELVKLQLSTLNAVQVRLNQLARVSIIGPDPTIYQGRVVNLYPQAIASNSDSSQSAQTIVPTTIQLDRPTGTLIPGSPVNVELVLQQRQNVLTLEIEALQRDKEASFVWLMDGNGRAQQQPVTLGLEGLTEVEVTTGLRLGDRVILPPPDVLLTPGIPVVPAEATPNLPADPDNQP